MAAAFVQGTGIQSSSSVASLSKAFVSNVTAGSALAVGVSVGAATAGASSCSGGTGGGGTMTQAVVNNHVSAGNAESAQYYALNVTGGAVTVTFTPTSSDFCGIGIAEFSGIKTTSALDGTGAESGTASSTTQTTTTWTTTGDGVSVGCCLNNEAAATITIGGGATLIYDNDAVTSMPINFGYKLTTGVVSASMTWTFSAARKGNCVGMNLLASTSPPPPPATVSYLPLLGVG